MRRCTVVVAWCLLGLPAATVAAWSAPPAASPALSEGRGPGDLEVLVRDLHLALDVSSETIERDGDRYETLGFFGTETGLVRYSRWVGKTVDGGEFWFKAAETPAGVIEFINERAWVVGSSGALDSTVFHATQDGGQSWTSRKLPFGLRAHGPPVVFHLTPEIGWAVKNTTGDQPTELYYTRDGWRSWTAEMLPTDDEIASVVFLSARTGWMATSGGEIWHTGVGQDGWVQELGEEPLGASEALEAQRLLARIECAGVGLYRLLG